MQNESALVDRRVYVIDDDALVRATIRRMLTGAGIYSQEFETAADFLDDQSSLPMGCILLDLRLPSMSGLELLRILKRADVRDPVVMISGQADLPDAVDAIKAGALDFLQKPFRKERLLEVVNDAFEVVRSHQQRDRFQRTVVLTDREKQVLSSLAEGATSKLTARQLGISSRTVEMHRANILKKLGAQTAAQAVFTAKENGLLRP